jgi:tetratricopeptide (TPR) repeat protein
MPRLQDIERFKRDLAALSHEAEVLERWGEKPEDIPPPEDASAAPGSAANDKPDAPLPDAVGEDEGLPSDFAALLDNLPIDREEAEDFLDAPEEGEGAPEPSDMPGFDIPTIADEPSETGTDEGGVSESDLSDFVLPDLEEPGETSPPEESVVRDNVEPAEDFSIPDLGGSLEKTAEPDEGSAPEESFSLGESEIDGDAFETFGFEEQGAGLGESGGSTTGAGAARDLDTEIASLSEEAPAADTFKIDQDWGDFGSLGAGGPSEAASSEAPPKSRSAALEASEEKFRPVSLSEAQADRLQDSLLSFPLNLRVAIEDILANDRGSEAQQSRLVWALVDGVGAEDIADLAGRILKRRIPIPKGRDKRTGAAMEAEKGSLGYIFVHTFLPVIKIGVLVLAVAAALGYLGWRYIYVPLASDSLYRRGYQLIAEDRYPEAETDFAKATEMREFINWYYRYAAAYAAKREYILAEKKYAALVDAHPKERKGIIAWARLEREQLKYEEAIEVLKGAPRNANNRIPQGKTGLLSWDYFNEEGLLLLGDVYLDWSEEAPAKYEDARRTYATLIEHYGVKDVYLERMLLYFIRTDRLSEVLPLKAHFLADPEKTSLDAGVLAELGGYLLDKDLLEDVRFILLTAAKKDPSEPEAHYQLSRYFRRAGDPTEERKSLDNAVRGFAALPGLGGRRTGMYIDSLIWRARFLAQAKEWLGAERDYATAAAEYEKALELRRVKKDGRFGEAYAGLADVAYWQRDDLTSALALYGQAAANGFTSPDTSYKRGNILYRMGRYAESLEQFFEAGSGNAMSPYLAYAFGSALYARNDLFSAEAYFRKASAAMEKELADVGELAPQERPSEIDILKLYMQSENNLGVALYRSAARSGDARRRNQAMIALTHAVQLYDQLSQAPSALEGPEPRNLGLANMNTLLKTGRGEDLLVYSEIEKDMRYPKRA